MAVKVTGSLETAGHVHHVLHGTHCRQAENKLGVDLLLQKNSTWLAACLVYSHELFFLYSFFFFAAGSVEQVVTRTAQAVQSQHTETVEQQRCTVLPCPLLRLLLQLPRCCWKKVHVCVVSPNRMYRLSPIDGLTRTCCCCLCCCSCHCCHCCLHGTLLRQATLMLGACN